VLYLVVCYWLRRIGLALARKPFSMVLLEVKSVARAKRFETGADIDPSVICAAVRRCAANLMPRYTCLPQALVGYLLCMRYGYRVRLRAGIVRRKDKEFLAHAWLEHDGEVVLGDLPHLSEFAAFDRAEELVL
jgi:hypothetical protein